MQITLDAADSFERALALVSKQQRACQDAVGSSLRQAIRDVRGAAAKRGTSPDSIQTLRLYAAGMVIDSGLSPCPSAVTQAISDGVGDLNGAYDAASAQNVQRQPRRQLDDEPIAAPAPRRQRTSEVTATMGRLRIAMDSPCTIDGSPAVLLEPTNVVLDQPATVYYGMTCTASRGRASTEWSLMRPFAARAGRLPDDASFNIRYSTLDAIDAGDGRFTCHVDLFDARTRAELAWAEAAVQTPEPAAMPVARRAAPNAAPAVFAAPRGLDCGTGNDPGCVEQNGSRPMDGIAFSGLISSLRSASGD